MIRTTIGVQRLEGATWATSRVLGEVATEDNALYRLRLWRTIRWEGTPARLAFIGLNPSIAGSRVNDPTIRRELAFARAWGFDRLEKVNLFAWRATDPNDLAGAFDEGIDVVGPGNDEVIVETCERASVIVCAWGTTPHNILSRTRLKSRVPHVLKLLRGFDLRVIETPASYSVVGGDDRVPYRGAPKTWKPLEPRHPLYLPKESRLALWRKGERS